MRSRRVGHSWVTNFQFYIILSGKVGEGNGTPLQYSCLENPTDGEAWWAAVHGVTKSWTQLSDFIFTFHFHALEKEMATHSSILAWRIPGTGEPGGLESMRSHRVGHDWSRSSSGKVKIRNPKSGSVAKTASNGISGFAPPANKTCISHLPCSYKGHVSKICLITCKWTSLILGTLFIIYLSPTLCSLILVSLLLDVMAGTGATILDLEMTMNLGMEVKQRN